MREVDAEHARPDDVITTARDVVNQLLDDGSVATRKASNAVENAVAERIPWMLAGSADLTESTSVRLTFEGAAFEPGKALGWADFPDGTSKIRSSAPPSIPTASRPRPRSPSPERRSGPH